MTIAKQWINDRINVAWLRAPTAAFLITRVVVFFGAFIAEVALPSEGPYNAMPGNVFLDVWARWDSAFYLDIVEMGYAYIPGQQSSVAFFPLYPLLVDALHGLGLHPVFAGVVVSHAALFGALVFLYRLTLHEFGDAAAAQRTVFYISAFPTAFFFSAVYTESLFLLLAVATFYFARTRQWGWAVVAGALTGMTRIVGILMWGVVGLEWLTAHGWRLSTITQRKAWGNLWAALRTDWPTLTMICLIPAGMLSHMAFLARHFDDPIAFWTVQSAWGRENLGPVAILVRDISGVVWGDLLAGELWWHVVLDVSAIAAVLAMTFAMWRTLGESYTIYALLAMLIPASSGSGSLSRYILVAFPVFMLLGLWLKDDLHDRTALIGFTVFLGILTTVFVNWVFVA
jgi:hypothetical protein